MQTKTKHFLNAFWVAIFTTLVCCATFLLGGLVKPEELASSEQPKVQNTLTLESDFSNNKYVIVGGKVYLYNSAETQTTGLTSSDVAISFDANNKLELIFIEDSVSTLSSFAVSEEKIASILTAEKTSENINITITDKYDEVEITTSHDAEYVLGELVLASKNRLTFEDKVFKLNQKSTTSFTATAKETAKVISIAKGELTLSGSKTYSPKSGETCRAVYQTGGELTLTTVTLSGFSYAGNGGAVYMSGGTLNANGTISGSKATSGSGGAIYCSAGTINISSGVIGNSGATSTATSSTYSNYASSHGGGIYICNASTLNISDTAVISYNCASAGGGVFSLSATDKINISGGTVKRNYTTSGSGGGIYTYGIVTMTAGTFTYNTANTYGGGIMIKTNGNNTISGGSFTYNKTETHEGGGIRCDGHVNISGGTISNNTAKTLGGGVSGSGTVSISGGTIQNNTAGTYGGGIHVNSTFTLTGGTISGNTASTAGPQIALAAGTYITLTSSLSTSYTVYKMGLTSYDDNTGHSSSIAYSTTASYLTTAQSKITVTNLSADQQLVTTRRTNYLVCEWSTHYLAINPDNTNDEYYNETTYGAYIETAGTFDGNDYKLVSRNYMFTDKITVNVWAYMTNWSTYANNTMRIFSCTEGGGWNIEPNGANIAFACYDKGASDYDSVISSTTWSSLAAGWHMFTLTFDGTYARGYVDGQLIGTSGEYTAGIGYPSSNAIFIGAESGSNASTPAGSYFSGNIQDFTILNDSLYQSELADIYAAGRGKIIVSKNYLETYTIDNPTRTGYTFNGWTLAGSGYIEKGQESSLQSGFTRTNNTYYENFKFSVAKPTSDSWYCVRWPSYSFIAGHSYRLTYKIRINTMTGTNFTVRFARLANDYFGCPSLTYSSTTSGWVIGTLTQTLNSSFVYSGSTKTESPLVEIYTNNLKAGTTSTLAIDFDIKDIVVTDITDDIIAFAGDSSYLFENGNGTATATWTANTYYVKFNGNGSTSGSMSNQTHTYDTALALTANAYAKTGHTFKGWATSSTATSATYADKQSVKNLSSTQGATVNLYAVWQINYYTVTIARNNTSYGTVSKSSLSVPYGTTWSSSGTTLTVGSNTITATPTAIVANTQTTYVFSSWSAASGTVTGDTTITAMFDASNVVVSRTVAREKTSGGFYVYANVSWGAYATASKVEFPTWTNTNGQDDIIWYAGTAGNYTVDGETYNYRAKVLTTQNHTKGGNDFITHIYAYATNSTRHAVSTTPTTYYLTYTVTINSNNNSYGSVNSSGVEVPYMTPVSNSGNTLTLTPQVQYSNMVATGNFESTANWSGAVIDSSQAYIGSSSLKLSGTTVATTSIAKPIVGHKYYAREWIKSNGVIGASDMRFEMFAGDGVGLNWVFGTNSGNFPNWTMISGIVSVDVVNGSSYVLRTFVVNAKNTAWIDGIMLIDLTAKYGAGNEPTKEWCDGHIPDLERVLSTTLTVTATPTTSTAQYTYAFSNWTNGTGNITGDTTITANFTRSINKYTITFDHQGGTGGPSNATYDYGTVLPSITCPTRTGYTFNGYVWPDGTTYIYNSSGQNINSTKATVSVTLYAQWTVCVYMVDINVMSPSGVQDGASGTFTQYVAYTNSTYTNIADQATGNLQYKTSMTISAISPATGMYLYSVSANIPANLVNNGNGTYTYTANFSSNPSGSWDDAITIQMKWNTYTIKITGLASNITLSTGTTISSVGTYTMEYGTVASASLPYNRNKNGFAQYEPNGGTTYIYGTYHVWNVDGLQKYGFMPLRVGAGSVEASHTVTKSETWEIDSMPITSSTLLNNATTIENKVATVTSYDVLCGTVDIKEQTQYQMTETNIPENEVWLDDKFRKLQEPTETEVDFDGVTFM